MNIITAPAISAITFPSPSNPAVQCSRIYTVSTDGMIHEYCQDGVGTNWYTGALRHQGSGSISALYYTTPQGARRIDVFSIYSNRINCWTWDFSAGAWSGGSTQNYGQDYVFASRTGNTTLVVTRNPKNLVTYVVDDKGWHPSDGPDLSKP